MSKCETEFYYKALINSAVSTTITPRDLSNLSHGCIFTDSSYPVDAKIKTRRKTD